MSVKHSHKKRKDFPFLMTMVKLMKGISQEKKKRWIDFLERSYFWNDMQLSHCVDNNITHILPSGSQNKAKLSYCMRQPSVGVFINTFLKICSKFTGENPCRSAISIKLQIKSIEITLQHGCSPVNSLYVFKTPLFKNTSGGCFWR